MPEQFAEANGLRLAYDTFGDPEGEPLLLIMGLGAQMITWPEEFCYAFVDRGFRVIRFDNRDCGLSEKLDWSPDELDGQKSPYTLSDMAADAVGLLDALEIPAAHVLGMSMGGMIAQTAAIEHPHRVITLTSMSSTTGNGEVGRATREALAALSEPGVTGRDAAIEQSLRRRLVWGTPGHYDESALREFFAEAYDRSSYPTGSVGHFLAVAAAPDREPELAQIQIPTLVVHGDSDPLVDVSGGVRTAEVIPDAELLILEEMAHDLPPPYWARVVSAVTALAARAMED